MFNSKPSLNMNFYPKLILLFVFIVQSSSHLLNPEIDENYYNLTLGGDSLYEHNQKQNIYCDVEDREFYNFTHHNFNTPTTEQTLVKIGFYPSIVYVNQEIENRNGSIVIDTSVSSCLGVILTEYFVLTFKDCLRKTYFKTVIRYGALSNNCSGCPITVAKEIVSNDQYDVSLIFLQFPIKFTRLPPNATALDHNKLNQVVGPSCEFDDNKRKNFLQLTWFNLVSRGLNRNNLDFLYHKATQAKKIRKNLIKISSEGDKLVSQSFLFLNENEKVYLVGVCSPKPFDNYYCLNMRKYKDFIKYTINSIRNSSVYDLKMACTKPPEVKDEVGIHTKSKVEITLGDCLACSGCITSAETVLIQQQSDKQVYQVIEQNKVLAPEDRKVIVVSLSLQAISSIAAKYELEFQEAAERLCTYFRSLGVDYVFDISLARHLTLHESQREFIKRFKVESQLCLLSSICPGFVCYVEKTHGELLTPFLSTVKSPQQVFGTLLKQIWSINESIKTERIFHISLMPCFDKKLEASRKEFIIENEQHEVDCVLTPIELENMMIKDNCDLCSLEPTKLDNFLSNFTRLQALNKKFNSGHIKSHLGSGSGGYAENIFRMISSVVFDQRIEADTELNFEMKRNKDYLELDLKIDDKVVFRTALINGFRNIQTLIQRIKRGTCKYNYVEVMACPSGCLNGGGLLRDVSLEIVNKIYSDLSKLTLDELEQEFRDDLYAQWFDSEERTKKFLHTSFNIIPKAKNSININW